jgi:hypothetical protein
MKSPEAPTRNCREQATLAGFAKAVNHCGEDQGRNATADIESLLVSAGARVIEGSGSAVRFECNGVIARFHRPHPDKDAKRYQVKDARAFLSAIGVRP